MQEDIFLRQKDLVPSLANVRAMVIGVGGIGSNIAVLLASMGVGRLSLWDSDRVGEENIAPGAFAPFSHKRQELKTKAVAGLILGVNTGCNVSAHERYLSQKTEADFVFVCVDSIAERKLIADKNNITWTHWIDLRMGGTQAEGYWVSHDGFAAYRSKMDAVDITEAPCGQKSTAPVTKGAIPAWVGTNMYLVANSRPPVPGFLFDLAVPMFEFLVSNE